MWPSVWFLVKKPAAADHHLKTAFAISLFVELSCVALAHSVKAQKIIAVELLSGHGHRIGTVIMCKNMCKQLAAALQSISFFVWKYGWRGDHKPQASHQSARSICTISTENPDNKTIRDHLKTSGRPGEFLPTGN